MIKIAVCDAEENQLEQLLKYSEKYTEEQGMKFEITLFQSRKELMQLYQYDEVPFDVIFLDIYLELDNKNERDVANAIREKDKDVFILFLINSMDDVFDEGVVNSFRYLMKPLEYEQFTREIDAVSKELQNNKEEILIIETSQVIYKLPLCEIIYLESKKRKIRLVTINNNEVEFYGKLSDYNEKLSKKGFLRIHRSYVVNLLHIREIHGNNIKLTTGEMIYFNKHKRGMIKEEFLMFHTKGNEG